MLSGVLFLTLAFAVSILSATFGFGSAMILIPFSSFFLPIKQAIAIITIFFIATNISKIILFRRYIDWKIVFLIWIGAVPMVFVGASLLVYVPSELIERILGAVVLLYVINDYFKFTKHIRLNKAAIACVGGVYGFSAGITGMSGGIKAALLNHIGLRKERFIAVMSASAILLNFIKTAIYSKSSLVTTEDIPLVVGLIICAFLGTYIGKNLVKTIAPETFRKIILLVLFVVSLKLLIFG
jgi:uncharacterized membrane protein YfcA